MMVFDQSGHVIDEDRAKGYTGYFVNPGDMGVWPFKNNNTQKSRGGKYQGQEADVTGNKTGYSFVSPKAGLTWAQLKERWQKKREERAAKKQPQAPAQPEQRAPVQPAPAPQASTVPPTQNEIIKGTDYGMKAGVPYENKNGEKRVFVPSQNNDPARANIGGGVAKGMANREVAKQAAQAPAYQPSSEKEAQFYARAQMNKAAQQGRANMQSVQPAQMQAGQLWQAQSVDPETQKILAQKKQEHAAKAMTASQARDEYWRRNLGNAQQDLRNGTLDFGE